MPSKAEIILATTADLRGIRQTEAALRSLQGTMGTAGRILAAGGLFGAGALTVEGIASSLTNAATAGVRFNSTLEQTALGIAALFRTFAPQQFASLDAALAGSAGTLSDLKVAARLTTASFEELAQAYQAIAGPAFAAGIPIDKQIRLTTMLAQAVTGLGLPSWQIPQEGRSILSGTIGPDSTVARALGITNAEVSRSKAQGNLFGYLETKLASFAEAGNRAGQTLAGAASNLKDTFAQMSGAAMEPVNEALTAALLRTTEALSDPRTVEAMKGFATGVATLAEKLPVLAEQLPKLAEASGAIVKLLTFIGGAGLAFKLAPLAKWLGSGMGAMATDFGLSSGAMFPGLTLAGRFLPANLLASELAAVGVQSQIAGGTLAAGGIGARSAMMTSAAMQAGFGLPFIGQLLATTFGGYQLGGAMAPWVPQDWMVGLLASQGLISQKTAAEMLQTAFPANRRPGAGAEVPGYSGQSFERTLTPEEKAAAAAENDRRLDDLEFKFRNKLVSLDDYLSRKRSLLVSMKDGDKEARAMALQNLDQFAYEQRAGRRKQALDGLFDNLKAPTFAGAQRGMFQSQGSFAAWAGSVNYQKAAVDILQRVERLLESNNQLLRDGGTV
jgi:hypothetical protein